jgi:hypothetical protein
MNKLFVAAALAVTLAQPASAITFLKLTTIYVGAGVRDSGGAAQTGIASSIHCSNVSGQDLTIRFLVLDQNAVIKASASNVVGHGASITA